MESLVVSLSTCGTALSKYFISYLRWILFASFISCAGRDGCLWVPVTHYL